MGAWGSLCKGLRCSPLLGWAPLGGHWGRLGSGEGHGVGFARAAPRPLAGMASGLLTLVLGGLEWTRGVSCGSPGCLGKVLYIDGGTLNVVLC